MRSVIAELEQGSEWDSRMLLLGVLIIIAAFLATYDTELWNSNDELFLPLLSIGISFVVLNIILRILRPKLKVTVIEIQDNLLKICPIKNLQFSGWVAGKPVEVEIANIKKAKVYDFHTYGTNAGMYWVCFELENGHVFEYSFNDYVLVKKIIEFIKGMLPTVELNVDKRIKI